MARVLWYLDPPSPHLPILKTLSQKLKKTKKTIVIRV